jgi:hypothetical protein
MMTEQNILKTDIEGNGFKVSVIIEGDKVQIAIDDRSIAAGITVVNMYHNDHILRIGTDHTIQDVMIDYKE